MLPDQRPGAVDVIVGAEDKVERGVDRDAAAAKIEQPAVIAAGEHHDLVTPRDMACGRHRHEVCLGARIGEAHPFKRGKALRDQFGQARLGLIVRTEIESGRDRLVQCVDNDRVAVTEDPGGVFTEQIEIAMAVGVDQAGAFAAFGAKRERSVVEDRAGIAAGQVTAGRFVHRARFRAAIGIDAAGFIQCCVKRDIALHARILSSRRHQGRWL